MNPTYFGNSLEAWLIAAGIAAVAILVLALVQRVLVSRLGALSERTANDFDDAIVDVIRNTRSFFLVVVGLTIAARGLTIPERVSGPLAATAQLLMLVQVGLWASGLVAFLVERSLERRQNHADRIGVAAIRAIGITVKILAWILILVLAVQLVFDKPVTALVTGLGVGGIAIALAVQNILGDILAAVAIVFDQPFDVGDTIAIDDMVGTVEQIGLKTTRLRSITGEQLVIGNGELLRSRLRNFKRMVERRITLRVDVVYSTPADVMARLPRTIEQIISARPDVRFDRAHFAGFMDSSLRIEAVYYVLSPEYRAMMDAQEGVNLEVLRRFNAEGVDFAFPTRTVHMNGGASARA